MDVVVNSSNQKKEWIDVMRSVGQVFNRFIGFSDTVTDGFWILEKWSLTDIDASLQDLLHFV